MPHNRAMLLPTCTHSLLRLWQRCWFHVLVIAWQRLISAIGLHSVRPCVTGDAVIEVNEDVNGGVPVFVA